MEYIPVALLRTLLMKSPERSDGKSLRMGRIASWYLGEPDERV